MFGYPYVSRTLNIIKILGGISKTLNVANQLIPMYQKAKPMISNARNLVSTLKNINIIDDSEKINTQIPQTKKELVTSSLKNNPVFFI